MVHTLPHQISHESVNRVTPVGRLKFDRFWNIYGGFHTTPPHLPIWVKLDKQVSKRDVFFRAKFHDDRQRCAGRFDQILNFGGNHTHHVTDLI